MPRLHVFVSGRVQAVFFRESTRRKAEELGVRGWVRNVTDGRVEAVLEGPKPVLDAMVAWCRRGPEAAHVENLESWEEKEEGLAGFGIRTTAPPSERSARG